MDTVPGIDAARRVTVQVYDRGAQAGNEHRGQGLLLTLDDQRTIVLTCHHVIAPVAKENLCIRIWEANDQLSDPIPVQYDDQRSQPGRDTVVLCVDRARVSTRPRPLLHTLNPKTYAGSLLATSLTYMEPERFDAHVGATTRLDIPVDIPGNWPDPPKHYVLPVAYRLVNPTDARPGISGSVVLCENGVLGLVHFSRGAAADWQREAYLVPLSVWAEGLSELAELIEPFIETELRGAATIKRPRQLKIGLGYDVTIEGYQPELYIERDVDARARLALQQYNGVVIIGKPRSGKTRLAWRLLQEQPKALVVIPRTSEPPIAFNGWGLIDQDLVLFFDDLHETALSSRPLAWRERLQDVTGRLCLLVCTTRDGEEWKRVQNNQTRLLRVLGHNSKVFTSPVVEKGETKGEDLSPAQGWQLAQALSLSHQDFDQCFDGTPGSITLNLDEMSRRYERLRDEVRGTVPMSRLLDSAKLLYVAHQPRLRGTLLRDVAEQIRGEGRIGHDTWETVRRRTQEESFGQFDNNDEFRTYRPYLEECMRDYQPSGEEIGALLPHLVKAKDYEGLLYLGFALEGVDPLQAELAYRTSSNGGNTYAKKFLRLLLTKQIKRREDAIFAFSEEIIDFMKQFNFNQTIHPDIIPKRKMPWLFCPGGVTEREQILKAAIEAGIKEASFMLGALLASQPGREGEAEQTLREASMAGNTNAKLLLGLLVGKQSERSAEAEQILREASMAGQKMATLYLGILLTQQPGREAEAEQVLRDYFHTSIDAVMEIVTHQETLDDPTLIESFLGMPDFPGIMEWGQQLFRLDRLDVQERFTRFVLAMVNKELSLFLQRFPVQLPSKQEDFIKQVLLVDLVQGYYLSLGELLAKQPGRETETEQAFRDAIDAGERFLAKQPQQGGETKAERAFAHATNNNAKALAELGDFLLRQPSREAEAEQVLRAAMGIGSEYSKIVPFYLGVLLSRQPGREAEAKQLFQGAREFEQDIRDAITAGMKASYLLGTFLAGQPGREAEAEQALRDAIVEGDEVANFPLGVVLAKQPGREAEAEQALREAIAAGIKRANFPLGVVLAKQPGREAEAWPLLRDYTDTDTLAPLFLKILRGGQNPESKAKAEQVLRGAVDAGVKIANVFLGALLSTQSGRKAEAKQAFLSAINAGYKQAALYLGLLLRNWEPGWEVEAEELFRDAIDAGYTDAAPYLGLLLIQQSGREDEAEQVLQKAIAADSDEGYLLLGLLLARQPGREAEAEQAFRDAAAYTLSKLCLGFLLTQQYGREDEAKQFFQEVCSAGYTDFLEELQSEWRTNEKVDFWMLLTHKMRDDLVEDLIDLIPMDMTPDNVIVLKVSLKNGK